MAGAAPQPPPERSVYIQTFGCQMNDYDSTKMLEVLRGARYRAVDAPERADLILINSCAIREKPENKVYSLLGSLEPLKRARPGVVIGVGGCVAQQDGEAMLRRAPGVDLVFGTDNLFDLPEMLEAVARGERVVRTKWHSRAERVQNFVPDEALGAAVTAIPGRGIGAHESASAAATGTAIGPKAQIAITKGCDNMCTFCVVPFTRGREVSREPENILAEARALIARGAREITLLGQNVNSYRAGGVEFVELLQRLDALPGLARIRYTSPHPKDFDERLARAHEELPRLCEHLHLPFQSGSDAILRAMRRNHTIAEYEAKLARVRERVPEIALSTDVIVGFPGESEADFQATLDTLARVRFDHVYAFKFSPRTVTPAAKLPGQIDEATKAQRLERVLRLHESILAERNGRLVGTVQEVMVEGRHPRDRGAAIGRTRGHKSTTVPGCTAAPGTLVRVEVVATRKYSLVGQEYGGSDRFHGDEGLSAGA